MVRVQLGYLLCFDCILFFVCVLFPPRGAMGCLWSLLIVLACKETLRNRRGHIMRGSRGGGWVVVDSPL